MNDNITRLRAEILERRSAQFRAITLAGEVLAIIFDQPDIEPLDGHSSLVTLDLEQAWVFLEKEIGCPLNDENRRRIGSCIAESISHYGGATVCVVYDLAHILDHIEYSLVEGAVKH